MISGQGGINISFMIFGSGIIYYGVIDNVIMVVYDVVFMFYEFVGIDVSKLLFERLILLMIGVSFKCYLIGESLYVFCI